jgi:hypothetical protein
MHSREFCVFHAADNLSMKVTAFSDIQTVAIVACRVIVSAAQQP